MVELLVVLVILGVLMGAVSLSVAPVASRRIDAEATRLVELFKLARDTALDNGQPIRWQVGISTPYQYAFYKRIIGSDDASTWVPMTRDGDVFRARTFEPSPDRITQTTLSSDNISNTALTQGAVAIEFSGEEMNLPVAITLSYPTRKIVIKSTELGDFEIISEDILPQ